MTSHFHKFKKHVPMGFSIIKEWGTDFGLLFQILNNIPMADFNIDGKVQKEQTLMSLFLDTKRERINEGIDIVFGGVRLIFNSREGLCPKENQIVIRNKEEFKKRLLIHGAGEYFVSIDGEFKSETKRITSNLELYNELLKTTKIAKRLVKIKASKIFTEMIDVLVDNLGKS